VRSIGAAVNPRRIFAPLEIRAEKSPRSAHSESNYIAPARTPASRSRQIEPIRHSSAAKANLI
jgi:hypothetical protein